MTDDVVQDTTDIQNQETEDKAEQPQEKLVPQSMVDKAVLHAKDKAYEKGRREAEEQFKSQESQRRVPAMADQNSQLTTDHASVTKSLKDAEAKIAKAFGDDEDDDDDEKKKKKKKKATDDMTDVQKSYFDAQDAKIEKLEKAADAAENIAFVAKAEGFGLPEVKGAEFGPVLKDISTNCSTDTLAAILKVLGSVGETIKKSALLNEVGADGEPEISDNEQKLNASAAEIQKKEGCTHAVAIVKALELNPEYYS